MPLEDAAVLLGNVPPPPAVLPPYIAPAVDVPPPPSPSAATPYYGCSIVPRKACIPELTFETPETSSGDALSQDSTSQDSSRSEHSLASKEACTSTPTAGASGP